MRREVNSVTGEVKELPDVNPVLDPPVLPADEARMDMDALNLVLAQEGSVFRAGMELLFGVMKGTIVVDPTLTPMKFKALLLAKMRTKQ